MMAGIVELFHAFAPLRKPFGQKKPQTNFSFPQLSLFLGSRKHID